MNTPLIQILSPETKQRNSSCRNVKIPKNIIKTKVQSHGCFGFKSIYPRIFVFKRELGSVLYLSGKDIS